MRRRTSDEAWESFIPVSSVMDRRIMATLDAAGLHGCTCDEIEAATGSKHQAVSGNLRHLVERGCVYDTGRKRKIRSGRTAMVWVSHKFATAKPPSVQAVLEEIKTNFLRGARDRLAGVTPAEETSAYWAGHARAGRWIDVALVRYMSHVEGDQG